MQGVVFRYPLAEGTTSAALDGVDLRIRPGEFVAILGGNGSGKSTLARMCNGLLVPDQGRVLVSGMDTRHAEDHQRIRQRVGLVFQDPDNQIVASTVEDDVAFGPENLGLPRTEIGRRVRAALDRVGLADLAQAEPHRLSGGQKQRLAIAGVLAMEPACLCLDEPTASLDPRGRAEVLAALESLHGAGHAVLLITHHASEAVRAERVLVLHQGRVVCDQPARQALADPERLAMWGVEPPPAVLVWNALGGPRRLAGPCPLTPDELADRIAARVGAAGRGVVPPADSTPAPAEPRGADAAASGLSLENLVFRFSDPGGGAGTRPALDGVGLHLAPGECVGLLGATGSGKSTLALHAALLLRPQAGAVRVEGALPWQAPRLRRAGALRAARRRVGLVFQRPEDQFFEERVEDEVTFGPLNYGFTPTQAQAAARAALEAAGLPAELGERSPFQLSGGQMRRVAIAASLAWGPRYLLLDEPTAGLDAEGRRTVLDLLARLRAAGHSVLFITHRMEEAGALADRLVVLDRGHVVAAGTPRAVFGLGAALAAWGLEPPAATELLHALRARGVAVPATALTLEEAVRAVARLLPA